MISLWQEQQNFNQNRAKLQNWLPELFTEAASHPAFLGDCPPLKFTVEEFLIELSEASLLFLTDRQEKNIIKEHIADDKFFACALASQAKYIVSGDKHLLSLKNFQGIAILTPRQFLARLKE